MTRGSRRIKTARPAAAEIEQLLAFLPRLSVKGSRNL
jgi:hypothetical protein